MPAKSGQLVHYYFFPEKGRLKTSISDRVCDSLSNAPVLEWSDAATAATAAGVHHDKWSFLAALSSAQRSTG